MYIGKTKSDLSNDGQWNVLDYNVTYGDCDFKEANSSQSAHWLQNALACVKCRPDGWDRDYACAHGKKDLPNEQDAKCKKGTVYVQYTICEVPKKTGNWQIVALKYKCQNVISEKYPTKNIGSFIALSQRPSVAEEDAVEKVICLGLFNVLEGLHGQKKQYENGGVFYEKKQNPSLLTRMFNYLFPKNATVLEEKQEPSFFHRMLNSLFEGAREYKGKGIGEPLDKEATRLERKLEYVDEAFCKMGGYENDNNAVSRCLLHEKAMYEGDDIIEEACDGFGASRDMALDETRVWRLRKYKIDGAKINCQNVNGEINLYLYSDPCALPRSGVPCENSYTRCYINGNRQKTTAACVDKPMVDDAPYEGTRMEQHIRDET